MRKNYFFIFVIFLLSTIFGFGQENQEPDFSVSFRKNAKSADNPPEVPLRSASNIQSKYIQLQNGGCDMIQLGDPDGNGNFNIVNGFKYNFGGSNRYVIFTGLPVPDANQPGTYLPPVMQMVNPSGPPSINAFTVNNVSNPNAVLLGNPTAAFPFPENAIDYHDKIDGTTGLPNPDGIMDGFTGSTTAVNGFLIELNVQIGLNAYSGVPDMIEFFFSVTNTSTVARVFGLSWNVDTYVGYDIGAAIGGDLAPFYVTGCRQFRIDQAFVGFPIVAGSAAETYYYHLNPPFFQIGYNPYSTFVPEYFYALHPDDDYSALIITNLGLRDGVEWQKADYAATAHYSYIMPTSHSPYYFFGVNNGQPIDAYDSDSGHILRWDPQVVLPGETIYMAHAYGTGNGANYQNGVINFMDQMSPAIILTDPQNQYYTNSPFSSETKIINQSEANILSGLITLKIPRSYLRVENDMLAFGWIEDNEASNNDPVYDYYTFEVGSVNPLATLLVNPPVHLDVIPQYLSDVNTSYWLYLNVETDIAVEILPEIIQKNLFIPKLNPSNSCEGLELYAPGISEDGFIELAWQWLPPAPTDIYGFTLYQWDNGLGDWQTVSTNCDKIIHVLNVYPDIPYSNTLQTWMQDPNIGFGKIMVTPVTLTHFNTNPDFYLKNGSEYMYDVIMFGSWDDNYGKDLTAFSATAVVNFLKSGRGVLFGHDTQHWDRNFALLADYVNMYIAQNNINYFRGSTHIKIVNDGFLLKYPHHIPYLDILEVPCTHTSGQFAKGIVWMNFPDPQQGSCFHADIQIEDGGTNDFYLTTWNNAAMIQTGHSNGESTLDERRGIANTLWYLAQLTTDTTAKVCSAFDLAPPDNPTAIRQSCNQIDILSNDNGTPYRFYVKATNTTNNNDNCTSNILEVINKTGLKGFYILEDNNPDGVPEFSNPATIFIAAEDNQLITYTVQDVTKYFHIQAVDFADNLSEAVTLYPPDSYQISVSPNPFAGGSVISGGTIICETEANVIATPNPCYTFTNWTEGGTVVATTVSYTFPVSADRNLVANFSIKEFTITASAEGNGTIVPYDSVEVACGTNQSFVCTPEPGYHIVDILVDGISNSAAVLTEGYTFINTTANHTIHVIFATHTYLITTMVCEGGIMDPVGNILVEHGNNQTFILVPEEGFEIEFVYANGILDSVAIADSVYTFVNVNDNQTFAVCFKRIGEKCPSQVIDIGNNIIYPVIELAERCWYKENARSKFYQDGTKIPFAEPYYHLQYPNKEQNEMVFGLLYDYVSALYTSNLPPQTSHLICPEGWSIPNAAEWNLLTMFEVDDLLNPIYWVLPNTHTNLTDFDLRGAGMFNGATQRFEQLYGYTGFWSSDISSSVNRLIAVFNYFCNKMEIIEIHQVDALSVRCIKDERMR